MKKWARQAYSEYGSLGVDERVVRKIVADLLKNWAPKRIARSIKLSKRQRYAIGQEGGDLLLYTRDGYLGVGERDEAGPQQKVTFGVRIRPDSFENHFINFLSSAKVKVQRPDGLRVRVTIRMVTVPEETLGGAHNTMLLEGEQEEANLTVLVAEGTTQKDLQEDRALLERTMAHELTHVLDPRKRGGSGHQYKTDKAAYYNIPTEVIAYRHNLVRELLKMLKDEENRAYIYEVTEQEGGLTGSFLEFLVEQSYTWKQISEHLSDRSKQRMLRVAARVLQPYVAIPSKDAKFRPILPNRGWR